MGMKKQEKNDDRKFFWKIQEKILDMYYFLDFNVQFMT